MVRIAVVEDSIADWTTLSDHLDRYGKTKSEKFSISRFPDGMDFISNYKVDFDIILMDIDMPHMNGLDTARRLRQVDEGVALIFITNLAQYAINGYEVRALDFIVKPVEYRELEYKLNRALLYCRRHGEDALTLESAGVARRVPLRTIYYVEVYNHSLIYHTASGNIRVHGQLKDLEADSRFGRFAKCNSCYLVNCEQVAQVHQDHVLVGGDRLPISRRRKKAFMSRLAEVLGGEL